MVFLYQRKNLSQCWLTLLKQQISDKPTWLLSSGCSRFVKLCCFDFLYSVRRTTSRRPFPQLIHKLGQNELSVYRAGIKALSETYSPQAGSFFHRCNVKNDAFTALELYYSITHGGHRNYYDHGAPKNTSSINQPEHSCEFRESYKLILSDARLYISRANELTSNLGKSSGDFHLAISTGPINCNNKILETLARPAENTNGRSANSSVASSENETSESPRDNFSTSKPVDMFDSNLSQLRGVDGAFTPTLLSLQTLLTNEVANHNGIAFSTEKFRRSWQLSRRIWLTIVSVDENTNSEMSRAISTRL
ncbi:hypothetical protein EAG_10250 [Camponotus floridanus]|uniref:Uncharacterized protein n=1 Tax=Camponotus floridanus TaxID=104421 RepID=E2AQV9_CAMFO|nr:hypothetical protein EAG_10250 [Camponotus floridanus]